MIKNKLSTTQQRLLEEIKNAPTDIEGTSSWHKITKNKEGKVHVSKQWQGVGVEKTLKCLVRKEAISSFTTHPKYEFIWLITI